MVTVTWEILSPTVREYIAAGVGLMHLEQALRERPVEVAEIVEALLAEQEIEGRHVPEEVFAALREAAAPDEYRIRGYEVFERTAKARGNSAMLPVPVEYIGKRFKVVRLDP
jgi:hypothetical protein